MGKLNKYDTHYRFADKEILAGHKRKLCPHQVDLAASRYMIRCYEKHVPLREWNFRHLLMANRIIVRV